LEAVAAATEPAQRAGVTDFLDCYGRTVAEVIRDINISLAMVADGQAFAYRQYFRSCDEKEYLDAEYRASRHRYRVWQVEGGITLPWDFRWIRSVALIPDGTTPGNEGSRWLRSSFPSGE
jgi:endonuclease YncB( thermonuclease family)